MERIRILTVKIMMFCILIGSCLGMMVVFVQAEEDIPGVIFENSRNEAPDLYIKKQVKTAMEGIFLCIEAGWRTGEKVGI